jgi:hypothetical protein
MEMENKLIKVDNEYYLVKEQIVLEDEYGVSFSQGINGYGRGYHVFLNDGKPASKLTSICDGVCKIVYSTKELNNVGKLSKLNCDEIFGTVDIRSLSNEDFESEMGEGPTSDENINSMIRKGYVNGAEFGFNKSNELNKDKLFTIEDIRKAYKKGKEDSYTQVGMTKQKEGEYIESLLQPTVVEVEICYMNDCYINPTNCSWTSFDCKLCTQVMIKLDENGCIILRKKL